MARRKSLYLSGGGVLGAWQGGVLHELLKHNSESYTHIVSASAGSLNAACVCLAAYEVATMEGADLSTDAVNAYISKCLRLMWMRVGSSIPSRVETIMRMVFCLGCHRSVVFERESRREISRFLSLWKEGTVEGALKCMGTQVRGVHIPEMSIVCNEQSTKNHVMFRFRRGYMTTSVLKESLFGVSGWDDSNTKVPSSSEMLSSIVLASCSIPVVFPPVRITVDRSEYILSDGAMKYIIPFIMKEDMDGENVAKPDIVTCSTIDTLEDSDDEGMCREPIPSTAGAELSRMMMEERFSTKFSYAMSMLMLNIAIQMGMSLERYDSILTDVFGKIIHIPLRDPSDATRCTRTWKNDDYSHNNRRKLFVSGIKTYQAISGRGE